MQAKREQTNGKKLQQNQYVNKTEQNAHPPKIKLKKKKQKQKRNKYRISY